MFYSYLFFVLIAVPAGSKRTDTLLPYTTLFRSCRWVVPDRIVSALLRRLMAVEDVQTALAEKRGPKPASGLLVGVADRLVARMAPTVDSLGEAIDAVEDESPDPAADDGSELRLAGLRGQVVGLRRFISPQRDRNSTRRIFSHYCAACLPLSS